MFFAAVSVDLCCFSKQVRSVFLYICVVFSKYNILVRQRYRKAQMLSHFFPLDRSIVKDWYRGELSKAIELASESDLAFVMYYAPWDAESQAVRQEFDIAAQHMHKYVRILALMLCLQN